MIPVKNLTVAFILCSFFSFDAQTKQNNTVISFLSLPTETVETSPAEPVSEILTQVLKHNNSRIGNSKQIVLVTNENRKSKDVTIQTFENIDGQWVEKFTSTKGTIGGNGFAGYKAKIEGDGKTPTGIFYLGPVFYYPGLTISTKMTKWIASENDYWIDDVKSVQYNRWVNSDSPPNVSHEKMKRGDDKYKYGVAIQYNMDQVKGKGSVIVLHVLVVPGEYTAGCIAIPEKQLIQIIGWLDPAKKPTIISGSVDELLTRPVSGPALDKNDTYIWKKEKFLPPAR